MGALLVVSTLLLLLSQPPPSVEAHANLVRSEPASGAVLSQAPRQVQLWFSEEVEPQFSEVALFDRARTRLTRENARSAPGDARSLVLILPPDLRPSVYTAVWRVLSAVDGHVTAGSVPFTIGAVDPAAAAEGPVGAEAAALLGQGVAGPRALPVVARWLGLLGAAGVGGALAFGPLVWRVALAAAAGEPGVRRVGPRSRLDPDLAVAWRAGLMATRRLAWAGWALLLMGSVLLLLQQAADAANVAMGPALVDPLARLTTGTRYGQVWLARLGLLVVLGVALRLSLGPGVKAPAGGCRGSTANGEELRWRRWWMGTALVGLVLLTNSLVSHAAAVTGAAQSALALAVDWLHLAATAAWLGGLVQLAAALPAALRYLPPEARLRALAAAVPRFSLLASASVAVLILTGLYQAWLHVGSFGALVSTAHGMALALKLVLLAPLLLLGSVNLLVMRPGLLRLVRQEGAVAREAAAAVAARLQSAVSGEAALGAAVLLLVAFLITLPPASQPDPAVPGARGAAGGLAAEGATEDLRAGVRITPGNVGSNAFEVSVRDAGGRAVTPEQDRVERVVLRLTYLERDIGEQEGVLAHRGGGLYGGEGSFLSLAGRWEVVVLVRRSGRFDVRVPLALQVAASPGEAGAAGAAVGGAQPVAAARPPRDPRALVGGTLLVAIAMLGAAGMVGRRRRLGRLRAAAAAVPVVGGLALLVYGFQPVPEGGAPSGAVMSPYAAAVPAMNVRNPIPASQQSAARGRALYQEQCLVCHGPLGKGDGPAARGLRPPPADLSVHVAQHTEGQLYAWITKGIPGTAMPAFQGILSDEDRWHVYNYIETFATPAVQ